MASFRRFSWSLTATSVSKGSNDTGPCSLEVRRGAGLLYSEFFFVRSACFRFRPLTVLHEDGEQQVEPCVYPDFVSYHIGLTNLTL